MSDLKDLILFWIDTGAHRDCIVKTLSNDFSILDINNSLDNLISDGTITSDKNGFLVVTEWMPRTAERMKNGKIFS